MRRTRAPWVMLILSLVAAGPVFAQLEQDGTGLLECASQVAQVHQENLNLLSLSAGPDGLLLELADGDWGSSMGDSFTLKVDCSSGSSLALEIPGVAEVSDPWFDATSRRLWFVSRVDGQDGQRQRDLFFADLTASGWSQAQVLPAPFNSPADEYSPVIRGNHLYFASARDGDGDLFVIDTQVATAQPERLSHAINSQQGEWNLWVSGDEQTLIFEGSGRLTNVSVPGDLYVSQKDSQGRWQPAVALESQNRAGSDLNPRVINGQLIWAQSDRQTKRTRLMSVSLSQAIKEAERALQGRLLFAGRSSHEVGSIDLADGQPGNAMALAEGPHLLAISPSRQLLAAAAYGVFPRPHDEPVQANPGWVEGKGGKVLLWDLETGIAHYLASSCSRPHGAAWASEKTLWLSCEDHRAVEQIQLSDALTVTHQQRVSTGHPGAHVLAWDAGRDSLLATHTGGGGLWFGDSREFLPLGVGSEALHVLADGRHALVGIGPAGEVVKVDLEKRAEIARWDTGCSFPIAFATDAWRRTWVACMFSRSLQRIDENTGEMKQEIELPAGPLHVAAHPKLPLLYASLPRRNQVVEISMEASGVSREFAAGIEPDGLFVLPHQADVD